MDDRALVAYERGDGSYDVHYSDWGSQHLRLRDDITADTPYGGCVDQTHLSEEHVRSLLGLSRVDHPAERPRSDASVTTLVNPDPVAESVSFSTLVEEHLDFLEFDAVYVVSTEFEVTVYRTFWFGLEFVSKAVDRSPRLQHGALWRMQWYDGEPILDAYTVGKFTALKEVVGDVVDAGVFSREHAVEYFISSLHRWSMEGDRVLVYAAPREDCARTRTN